MPGALLEDGPVTDARIRAGDRLGGYQVLEQMPGAADPDRAPSPEGVSGLYRPLGTAVYKAQDPRNQELVADEPLVFPRRDDGPHDLGDRKSVV